jgi:hypothetical protein
MERHDRALTAPPTRKKIGMTCRIQVSQCDARDMSGTVLACRRPAPIQTTAASQ